MRGIKIILLALSLFYCTAASEDAKNKTKRGLNDQTHYFTASFKPLGVYADASVASSQAQPQGLSQYYSPKVPVQTKAIYEVEAPKVTAQHVLYEYQQTPTNTVSNVHFNQQFQTIPQQPHAESTQQTYSQYIQPQQPLHNPYSNVHAQETVVTPVQHSRIIQHTPFVSTPQANPQLLNKYLYLNGKVVYNTNPTHIQPQLHHPLQRPIIPQHHQQLQQQQQIQQQQRIPYQKLTPPSLLSPISYQNYLQFQPTTLKPIIKEEPKKPQQPQQKAEEEEEEENEKVQEDDDDDEDNERYQEEEEEEEDERPKYIKDEEYARYSFEHGDDEDDERASYKKEEEDDEDNERGATKYYLKKEPKRYSSSYKYKEGYKTEVKPNRSSKKSSPKKAKYTAYKYSKGPNGKPKIETIVGKPSQNVPVTVKKVYKEKWFITRNTDH